MALAAVGGLVILLVIALLAYLAVRTVEVGGGEDPAPVVTQDGTAEETSTLAASSAQEAQTPASKQPAESASTHAPVAVEGARALGVPSGKPLFRRTGTFAKTSINDEDENAIPVPAHDGPVLVVWSSTGSGRGTLFVNGHEKKGGQLSASLPIVRPGTSGTGLINTGGYQRTTGVLYAQGSEGVSWEVRGHALSDVPTVERGRPVTGKGPRVFRVPAGAAADYRFSVPGSEGSDVPGVKVYAAQDLSLREQHKWGRAPVDLGVAVGDGEKIVVVDSGQEWSFSPR
ncbi:MAG TPA: hypothetical protein DDY46_08275 [Kocuria sp.]|nr:hypothetical protein [Kocuria sp.]